MGPQEFRRLALNFPDAIEKEHMNHPDFRVGGKIFATLGYPDKEWAMIKLSPQRQQEFVAGDPDTFVAVKGAWGKQGATNVRLKSAKKTSVQDALADAWQKAAAQAAVKESKSRPSAKRAAKK